MTTTVLIILGLLVIVPLTLAILKNQVNLVIHGETWPDKMEILEGQEKIDLHTKVRGKYIKTGEVTKMTTGPIVDDLLVLELDQSRFVIYKHVPGKGLIGSEITETSRNWITCKNLLYMLLD